MKKIELKINHLKPNSRNYISDYLQTLGIKAEDVNSFIGVPKNEDEEDPSHLDNITKAVQTSYMLLSKEAESFVQVDSDCDGYTSSAILISYLKRRFPLNKINWRLHNGKEHGIVVDEIPESAEIVYIPDAGSNQFKEHKDLVDAGKTVIVLDHHEITDLEGYNSSPAIIINNQISKNYENKFLSGAGVVYKFIKMMDRLYFPNNKIYQDYGDLAAIGIIADAMKMTTLDNNYLTYYGLCNIHNKFIHELAVKQSRGIKNPNSLTKIDVAFYIAPVINGVIRYGTQEDKEMVFKALINDVDENETFIHSWRGKDTIENIYQRAVRLANNAKNRQDSAKKKAFEWLCEEIRSKQLDKHNIIIVTLDKKQSTKVSANITGLIAMELVKEFNKPCLVLRSTELDGVEVFGGSGRNGNFYCLPNLKDMLAKAGGYYQEGHANAFGSFLLPEQIDSIREYFDKNINAAAFEDKVYEVDYWFHTGEKIDRDMLYEIAGYNYLWGNSIPQPKFAIDCSFDISQIIVMGEDSSSLKIKLDGVDCVAFKCAELIDELRRKKSGHITIIGRAEINDFRGIKTVQLIIDDIAILSEQEVQEKVTTAKLTDLI